jgi:hypothetical protein
MSDELASFDPATKAITEEAMNTAVANSTYFMAKNGTSVLSDETKYPTEALETVAAGLYSTIGLLLKVFATYSTDEQLQRMGPTLASLSKTLHQKVRFVGGSSLKGGADGDLDPLWDEAFGRGAQSGGNGSTSTALVPMAPAAPGALVPMAPAAPAAPNAVDPAAIVAQAQAALLLAQAGLVEAHIKERQAASKLTTDRAELASKILKQADPLTPLAREARTVVSTMVVEGALVGLLYLGGKGLAGLGLASAVVLIQVYSAVSSFQASKVLSGVGSAVGAGIFSVGTGIGGAVLNTISGILGMGSVTETIQLPSELSPSDEPSVLVEGRGFTPGVKLPPPPPDFPEIKALVEIQNLVDRIDFFTNRLLAAFFGESGGKDTSAYICIASVTFLLLYYFIGHLIDIVDEVRTRRKVDVANAVEMRTQVPAPAAPGFRALLGMAAPAPTAAPASALSLMGGKKRRTFRNNKRRTTRQKKATKVLGAPVFIY